MVVGTFICCALAGAGLTSGLLSILHFLHLFKVFVEVRKSTHVHADILADFIRFITIAAHFIIQP